jgi:NifU-like domain
MPIRTTSSFLQTIVSPFDESNTDSNSATTATATTTASGNKKNDGLLDLTWENVEMVLDEMRPFLIQDGGNVAITEIDGPVVRLELQVCCVPLSFFK